MPSTDRDRYRCSGGARGGVSPTKMLSPERRRPPRGLGAEREGAWPYRLDGTRDGGNLGVYVSYWYYD